MKATAYNITRSYDKTEAILVKELTKLRKEASQNIYQDTLMFCDRVLDWVADYQRVELAASFVLNYETKVLALADAYERITSESIGIKRSEYTFKLHSIEFLKSIISKLNLSAEKKKLYDDTLLWIENKLPFADVVNFMEKYEDYVEALADVIEN